ncbi:DUF1996 domain-containing protein [Saccharothrix sp. NPDC042600]|uniref:DUF1996 domain-containing protein n=1 Tax=Saccharothrix TaxID=2071 RepID=UPI00340D1110|nr:hypothetical protein GCM10017745_27880 [Saccharothrix mutabilis subsp. capreolus]
MRRLLPTLAVAVTVLSACGADGRYAALDDIPPPSAAPAQTQDASPGTYTVDCGRNEARHLNADNVVIAPGQPNGAHHTHEYIGNRTTTHTSTDETLAAGTTTCTNGDLSTYYWPVLRLLDRPGHDAHAPGGGAHGNTGEVLPPAKVVVRYTGSPVSPVVPLPRFTRLITGDATAGTAASGGSGAGTPSDATPADSDPADSDPASAGGSGAGAGARAASAATGVVRWGCEGVAGWIDRYPLCEGRRVVRGFEFPSCWDGRNIDSASHRAHVQFPASNGVCPAGTFPVPRLEIHVFYDVPAGRPYAIDSFPEQERDPRTDHAMGVNVMPDHVMAEVAGCLNAGRQCP